MVKRIYMTVGVLVAALAVLAGGTMAWFTSSVTPSAATFTAGTVSIAAGQVLSFDDDQLIMGSVFPQKVVGVSQGLRKDGRAVLPIRSKPNSVLNSGGDFFSLGFGGHIAVEFYDKIVTNDTIAVVVEVTGGSYPLEQAEIFLSMDGETWQSIGFADNKGQKSGDSLYTTEVRVPNLNFPYARFIKLVDITDKNLSGFPNDADGFDVDVIYVKNAYRSAEMNWNPGQCIPKTYTIENTGSKRIHLRGEFTGSWYEYNETEFRWQPWSSPVADVVSFNLGSNWEQVGNWFYYTEAIDGTFASNPGTVSLTVNVCLDGEGADDRYQGKRFIMSAKFEAVQASNGAAEAIGWEYDYTPDN